MSGKLELLKIIPQLLSYEESVHLISSFICESGKIFITQTGACLQ